MNKRNALTTVSVTALALTGCSQHLTYAPPQDHNSLADAEFVHVVAQQPAVSYGQLCRAALLVADGEDTAGSFEARVDALKSRGIVRQEWDHSSDRTVDRGLLAYMILRACTIPSGLNSRLAGWTGIGCERYALKDVVRQGIMPYGLEYQIPTGGEVMAALARGDDFMAAHGMYESTEREINSPEDVE